MSQEEKLAVSLPASTANVQHGLAIIRQWLAERWAGESLWAVELVLSEALTNIAVHACRDEPAATFACELSLSGGRLACRITDTGGPMPGLRAPAGREPPVNVPVEELQEGGYGWNLIRKLTRRPTYFRAGGINHLTFSMDVEAVAEAVDCRNDAPMVPQRGQIGRQEPMA